MPALEAEGIIEAISAALEFAHRNDIIHGDLKPGNVIITTKGDVKVIDFGIARLMTRAPTGSGATHAASGTAGAAGVAGGAAAPGDAPALGGAPVEERVGGLTPLYASPEMLELQGPDPGMTCTHWPASRMSPTGNIRTMRNPPWRPAIPARA